MTTVCRYYDPSGNESGELDAAGVEQAVRTPGVFVWADLDDPDAGERRWLRETFRLPASIARELDDGGKSVRYDWDGNVSALTLNGIQFERDQRQRINRTRIIAGARFVITVEDQPGGTFEALEKVWQNRLLPDSPIPYCVFLAADSVVDSFSPALDVIGDDIDRILDPRSRVKGQAARLTGPLYSRLHALLHNSRPLKNALHDMLRIEEGRDSPSLGRTRTYYGYIASHHAGVSERIYTYMDMLDRIVETDRTGQSNELNKVVMLLTVATIILSSGTLIVGFYGMNLQGLLIDSRWPYGAYLVLGVLAAAFAGEYLYFRRRGWVAGPRKRKRQRRD